MRALRLRDMTTGKIVRHDAGRRRWDVSRFVRVPPGSYIVELVDESPEASWPWGRCSRSARLETVATFIRLGHVGALVRGFFSNAAAAALASAAALGVTAVGNGGQPASGRS